MSQMICKCGFTMSTTQAPNDIELIVYSDREWDKICDCDSIEPWKIPLPQYEVWKCPKCQRVYVFEDGSNKPIMQYVLETN